MAKIIYGVSGHGFGHATRSREILKYLVSRGHNVLVFTYDQGLFFLDKEFDVFEIPGLTLVYKRKRVVYLKTIYVNLRQFWRQARQWRKISKTFRDFSPDLVITDFEIVTAVLARVHRRPLISIDNQHQLTNTKVKVPFGYHRHLWLSKLIVKLMVWRADHYLITSFFETPIIKNHTFLFKPVLREEILRLKPEKHDFFLVYQTAHIEDIIEELKKIDEPFVVFGSNREGREGNLEFKNYDFKNWFGYLANCRAIIGTSGSSLISECLHLKKPYLAIPLRKQTEQVINAQYLDAMGYGCFSFQFNKKVFEDFQARLPELDKKLANYEKNDNDAIFKKLDEIIASIM